MSFDWRVALDEVCAWARDHVGGERTARTIAERRDAVATWRSVTAHSAGLLTPVPLVAQRIPSQSGRFLDLDEDAEGAWRAGFDADGRPVVLVDDRDVPSRTWHYDPAFTGEIEWGGSVTITRVLTGAGFRGPGTVGIEVDEDDGGRVEEVHVQRWTWSGLRITRVEGARSQEGGWAFAEASEAEHDDDGVVLVRRGTFVEQEFSEDTRLDADRVIPALAEYLEHAATTVCDDVTWDGRIEQRLIAQSGAALAEPERSHEDAEVAAVELATAVARAVREAAEASGLQASSAAEVVHRDHDERVDLPPKVLVGGDAWRAGMVGHGDGEVDAFGRLWRGVAGGSVVMVDPLEHLDDDALRRTRELRALAKDRSRRSVADAALTRFDDTLVAALNEPGAWPTGAAPLLTVVALSSRDHGEWPLQRVRRVLGTERVDDAVRAFHATGAPDGPAPTGPDDARSTDPGDGDAEAALRDRHALELFLKAGGLGAHAARLAHEVACFGFVAVDEGAGLCRSRIGGHGRVPPDGLWPTSATGAALSLLAVIALEELDDRHRPSGWPSAGTLVFWGDLGEGEDGGPALIEPVKCGPGAEAMVVHVADDDDLADVQAPQGTTVVSARPVRLHPVLTLPDGYEAPEALGLDAFETESYERLMQQLREALPATPAQRDHHWVGGLARGVQGHEPEDSTQLVLHLAHDEERGLDLFGGGNLQFRIPDDAVPEWDLARIETAPEF